MRVALLSKRRYTGHDLIGDRYGRLYELPLTLARSGHTVLVFCLDYYQRSEGVWEHDAAPGKLVWESASTSRLIFPTLLTYPHRILDRLRSFAPDALVGASDIPHVALTAHLARRLRVPYAVDLYDNFEGFGQARIPGFVPMLRSAVRNADLVIAVSDKLRDLVFECYRPRGSVVVMTNSLDKSIFRPLDKHAARSSLGLPDDAVLIGTAGNLHRQKGVGTLYDAWQLLSRSRPDTHLVLAGPTEARFPPPMGERVHYLGNLSQADVACLFNALDVGVISVLDTAFGRYCFPQKASEMLACGLPVVAANVGATADLFADMPEVLFPPDDAQGLALAIERQLQNPTRSDRTVPDWAELVSQIEPELRALASSHARS